MANIDFLCITQVHCHLIIYIGLHLKNKYFDQKTQKNGFRDWDVSHFNTVAPRDPISTQDDFSGHGAGLK